MTVYSEINSQRFDSMYAVRNALFLALATLLFFPSVTFSLLQAEIFPWGLLFVVFFGRRIDTKILLVSVYLICVAILSQLAVAEPNVGESIRSLGAYLNCLLVFGVLASASASDIYRLSRLGRGLLVFLLALGLLQLLGLIGYLDPFMKIFVPRSSSTPLEFMGGRGVTLLSSEPGRAGIELVSIYVLFRLSIESVKGRIIADFCLGLFMLLVIKSAQAFAFYLAFLVIFYNIRLIKVIPVFLVGIVLLSKAWELDGRVVFLVKDILSQSSPGDIFYLISNTSGHRITSIISSYSYGVLHPIGGGIGNWMVSSVAALDQSGIDLSRLRYFLLYGGGSAVPIRSSGFITNLFLDVGCLGIVPVIYAIHAVLRRYHGYTKAGLPITLLFFAKIVLFGSVGNPVVWVSTVACIRLLAMKRDNCPSTELA